METMLLQTASTNGAGGGGGHGAAGDAAHPGAPEQNLFADFRKALARALLLTTVRALYSC
jgi:hypothetical protein